MEKEANAWKKYENEIKDERSSKKKRTLLYFLLVFLLVAQGAFWS